MIIRDQSEHHEALPCFRVPRGGRGTLSALWKRTRNHDMNGGQAALSLAIPQVSPHFLSSKAQSGAEPCLHLCHPQTQREPHIPMCNQSCFFRANPGHLCSLQRGDREERPGHLEQPSLDSTQSGGRQRGWASCRPRQCWAGSSSCSQCRHSPQLLPAALSHGCIWGARSSRHHQCFLRWPPSPGHHSHHLPKAGQTPPLPLPTPDTAAAPLSPV